MDKSLTTWVEKAKYVEGFYFHFKCPKTYDDWTELLQWWRHLSSCLMAGSGMHIASGSVPVLIGKVIAT